MRVKSQFYCSFVHLFGLQWYGERGQRGLSRDWRILDEKDVDGYLAYSLIRFAIRNKSLFTRVIHAIRVL